jgi:hypothetical protein
MNLKYVKLFEEHSIETLVQQKNELGDLKELGLLSNQEYLDHVRDLDREIRNQTKTQLKTGSQHRIYSAEWFNDIQTYPELAWLIEVVESPEYQTLIESGVVLSSSFTQLLNHTLQFTRNRQRAIETDWGLGLYGPTQTIRRLTPKTGFRDMDMQIKRFNEPTELDFFKKAMAHLVASIDFTTREFSSNRSIKADAARQVEQGQFYELILKLVKSKLPDSDFSRIQQIVEDLKSLLFFTEAVNRRKNIKALNNYFNTDQEVTLVVSEWKYKNRLTNDEKEVISDPRIKIITKNHY